MNFEKLLFSNNFITPVETEDITSDKQSEFKKFIENKKNDVSSNNNSNNNSNNSNKGSNDTLTSRIKQAGNTENVLIDPTNIQKYRIVKKSKVCLDSADRDTNLYPLQNDFEIPLGKTYSNVKKIELISTEFPNTDQVITELPTEIQNNIIAWENSEDISLNFYNSILIDTLIPDTVDLIVQNHNLTVGTSVKIIIYNSKLNTDLSITGIIDGERIASVIDTSTLRILYKGGISSSGTTSVNIGYPFYLDPITPGNYTASTIVSRIGSDLSKIKRNNGKGQYHYFDVTVNLDTDVISFDSVITTQLSLNSLSTVAGSTTITVNQLGHGFKTGDRVKMIGVQTLSGIDSSILNGNFTVNVLDFNTFTYEVNIRANATQDGGGNTIQSGKDAPFRLLFDTENTRIQFNIGFPDENSSGYIGTSDPFTTKNLQISNIIPISGNTKLRITTDVNHNLEQCSIANIVSISTGNNPEVTTMSPHGILIPTLVSIRNTNSIPRIDGNFYVTPTGTNTFTVNRTVSTSGNIGQVLYFGDQIKIFGLRTTPNILSSGGVFFIENIPSPNQFDISFVIDTIDYSSLQTSSIGTSQVTVSHLSHGFNTITSIINNSTNFVSCVTQLQNSLLGYRITGVSIIDGPLGTNTIDINLASHRLSTSDSIIIQDSTTVPNVNGVYNIQVVTQDIVRVNFVHSSFVSGTATILSGDKVALTKTNSLPRVDGYYPIHNRLIITGITSGSSHSTITVSTPHNWVIGDVINVVESNSVPNLLGYYTITSVIDQYNFIISLNYTISTPGSFGISVNTSRFQINTTFSSLTTQGTYGILGRDLDIIHYRATSNTNNIGGIPLSTINKFQRSIVKLIDSNTYIIRTSGEFASFNETGGGTDVRTSSHIDGFRSIQSNTFSGSTDTNLYRSINLAGQSYLFLVSPNLDTISNSSGISNVFAKLLLSESPGFMIYNSFVSAPKEFDFPIPSIDKLKLQVLTSQGYPFNLNNINYSISLEITEIMYYIPGTYTTSRTGLTDFENYSTHQQSK